MCVCVSRFCCTSENIHLAWLWRPKPGIGMRQIACGGLFLVFKMAGPGWVEAGDMVATSIRIHANKYLYLLDRWTSKLPIMH